MGHVMDAERLHAKSDKIDAIVNVPKPQNIQELQSLLSLINYYGKFIPNLATILQPLNNLLRSDVRWMWSIRCDEAVNSARQALVSSKVLIHYHPALPIVLATDVSQYGIGAVLSHVCEDDSEKPIAYA